MDPETRPILYGVADYAEIRKANAWFVDRTAKIRELEKVRYAFFLRPRRFGDCDSPPVANTTLVLNLFNQIVNGNFGTLEKLIGDGSLSEPLIDSFQAKELANKENFTSLLYWL